MWGHSSKQDSQGDLASNLVHKRLQSNFQLSSKKEYFAVTKDCACSGPAVLPWKRNFLQTSTWQIHVFWLTEKPPAVSFRHLFSLISFLKLFFILFQLIMQRQDHSRQTTGALICNSNSMWTTLTSSGDAVTFDSGSKTPDQLLLELHRSSVQHVKTAWVLKCKLLFIAV